MSKLFYFTNCKYDTMIISNILNSTLTKPQIPPPIDSEPKSSKKLFIDVLVVLSCFAVVVLHCNGCYWGRPTGKTWISANILESLFYFAVPCFFMITGYTLIDYKSRYSTKIYFKKRIVRTVIPFIIWSVIGFLIHFYAWGAAQYEGIPQFILGILNAKFVDIYWFFIYLFAIYLSIPFITNVSNKIEIFPWVILYAFVSYSIIPFICQLFGFSLSAGYSSPISAGYIIYVLLGYYLGNIQISKRSRHITYSFGIAGLLLHCIGTILCSPDGQINHLFKGYLNFPCVLYSVSIFIFCKYTNWSYIYRYKPLLYCLKTIAASSLGVYLIHIYFVRASFWTLHIPYASWTFRTLGAIVIFVLCVLIVSFVRRLPLGKFIFP